MRERSKKYRDSWQDPATKLQTAPTHRTETVSALQRLLSIAAQQTAQSKIVARFLLALHDSERFQFKLMDLRVLENSLFKDCMAVLGLSHETLTANFTPPQSSAVDFFPAPLEPKPQRKHQSQQLRTERPFYLQAAST